MWDSWPVTSIHRDSIYDWHWHWHVALILVVTPVKLLVSPTPLSAPTFRLCLSLADVAILALFPLCWLLSVNYGGDQRIKASGIFFVAFAPGLPSVPTDPGILGISGLA